MHEVRLGQVNGVWIFSMFTSKSNNTFSQIITEFSEANYWLLVFKFDAFIFYELTKFKFICT